MLGQLQHGRLRAEGKSGTKSSYLPDLLTEPTVSLRDNKG
jgi:hypothetical protein